jgi:hypothetical protein
VDPGCSKPLFISCGNDDAKKRLFSAKDIRETACDNPARFIEAAPHFEIIA